MSAKTAQTDDLLAQHVEAIAQREDAKTAGVRAGASRKLALIELELTIQGVPFEPYDPPKPISARKPAFSDEALLARIADVRRVAEDANVALQIRNTAENLLGKLIKQGIARGIIDRPEVTESDETPAPTKTTKRKSAGDQLADVERTVNEKVAA